MHLFGNMLYSIRKAELMPRAWTFPRVNRGSRIFRVEWDGSKPAVAEYEVQTAATSSIVVHDLEGKETILVGKITLRQFGKTPEEAVRREFERLAATVARHGVNARNAVMQSRQLAALLP